MKPSARLRTSPRCAPLRVLSATPSTLTSPAVGVSSPPSRCSSVLLPEPDAPTIAMRSPAFTARSTPFSTGTGAGPLVYVFASPRHSRTLLIPQRLRGIDARRLPGRIQRGEHGKHERDHGD